MMIICVSVNGVIDVRRGDRRDKEKEERKMERKEEIVIGILIVGKGRIL